MKIVIIGAGSVGSAICLQLAGEGHDLTIVDTDHAILTELSNTCDVFGVVGNGADVSVLRRAGAERADLLIAVTSGDEINILSCAAARKLGKMPDALADEINALTADGEIGDIILEEDGMGGYTVIEDYRKQVADLLRNGVK